MTDGYYCRRKKKYIDLKGVTNDGSINSSSSLLSPSPTPPHATLQPFTASAGGHRTCWLVRQHDCSLATEGISFRNIHFFNLVVKEESWIFWSCLPPIFPDTKTQARRPWAFEKAFQCSPTVLTIGESTMGLL